MTSIIKPKSKVITNYKAWIVILIWFIVSIIVGGAAGATTYTLLNKYLNSSYLALATGFASYSFILLTLLFFIEKFWKQKDILEALGMRGRLRWSYIVWAVAGFGAYILLSWAVPLLLAKLIHGFDPSALTQYGRSKPSSTFGLMADLLQVAILTPLIEEIMYRGYLFTEFKKFKMPAIAAIALVSVLFAMMHYPPWVWVVDTFIFGLVVTIIRQKTGNIWTGLGIHIAANSFAYFLLFYQ